MSKATKRPLALLLLLLAAFFTVKAIADSTHTVAPITAHIFTTQKKLDLQVEVAANEHAREIGLMNRKELTPYDGMAFFFPRPLPQKFWMKNTLIPLDILFVDEAGSIIYIVTGTPLSLEPIGPDGTIATVIELAGGRAAKEGIKPGDKVTYDIKGTTFDLAR